VRLIEAGISTSVGSVGDYYDNAMAETINGLFKAEVIHRRRPWRSPDAVEYATLEWVDWFNNRRLLEPIGNIPPAEFDKVYYTANASLAVGAGHTECSSGKPKRFSTFLIALNSNQEDGCLTAGGFSVTIALSNCQSEA